MNDVDRQDTQPRLEAQLQEARRAGGWIPWACAVLALAWWAGAAAYVIGKFGFDTIVQTPWAELGGAFGIAFAPGMALIMAGFMGRESARSSEANQLVMQAVGNLLSPARGHAEGIRSLSDAIREATSDVNDRLSEAEARIQTLKTDMEDSANAAMKAAEIVRADSEALRSKLAAERDGLTNLSDDLRRQLDTISDSLPKHAEKISRSAAMAREEMSQAGAQLDGRLNHIEETGKALANRVAQLDQMTADTRKRAQNLVSALVSINEQLLGSSRTVDNAVKAGDLALEASRTTAAAIKAAMDDALDGGRDTVERLTNQAESAKLAAERAIDRMNDASRAAEASVNSAMLAANKHADETERRMDQLSAHMFESASRATSAAEAGLERARSRIERATTMLAGMDDDAVLPGAQIGTPAKAPAPSTSTASVGPTVTPPVTPPPRVVTPQRPSYPAPETVSPSVSHGPSGDASTQVPPLAASARSPDKPYAPSGPQHSAGPGMGTQGLDEDILEPAPTAMKQASNRIAIQSLMPFDPLDDMEEELEAERSSIEAVRNNAPGKPVASSVAPRMSNGSEHAEPEMLQIETETTEPPVTDIGTAPTASMTWRDLLSGIDEPESRHETALAFVDQLGRAGIRLKRAIRSADLRRIATASTRGERQRRRAIQQAAPGELQQIERLLRQDEDLRIAAVSYLAIEEPDALKVLANAERAREDAGPRLAAYLLLDAAIG